MKRRRYRLWLSLSHLLIAVGIVSAFTQPNAQEPHEPAQVLRVSIVDGTATGDEVDVSGGVEVLRVTQGDAVEIHWASNERAVVHLHGYGVETDVPATGTAVMSFKARATGRFPVELHGFGDDAQKEKTLLYLEVHPR